MSMPLAAVPPELLSGVIANIDSKPTLCNLSRCSRRLYLCTVPHLYHHVTLREEIRHEEQPGRQLRQMASVLIQRPELARLVRNFTLHVVRSEESAELASFEKTVCPHSVQVDEAFETAINAWDLSTGSKKEWLGILSHAHLVHFNLILALLLPRLPKLRRLLLDFENGHDTRFLEEMMQRAARREKPFDTQTPFETLTSFVDKSAVPEPFSTDFIAVLLQLPAIQEISGPFKSLSHDYFRKDLRELDDSSSPLTRLDLAYRLDTPDLRHILRAPRALKSFRYVYPIHRNHFTDIRNALEPQKHCLESLSLDRGSNKFHSPTDPCWPSEPIISFISFISLKVFKTAAMFLVPHGYGRDTLIDIFPPSLETLHLTSFEYTSIDLTEALEYLLAQKSPQQIPRLKRLVLEHPKCRNTTGMLLDCVMFPDYVEDLYRRFSRLAAAQAVSLEVPKNSFDPQWLRRNGIRNGINELSSRM
ncbi:hypothetical protein MMC07_007985 [Pseudocyphellaria aurata]|nr:hypothetical protein [Pseudocyphellaria aurata]